MAHTQIVAKKPFDKLAAEIVHEILADVLVIPDEVLRQPSIILDAVLDPEFSPSSSVLLVCKRFFYIAKPLLFRTVMLRNNAQAQALEDALTGKDQHFAPLVKRLRIDGMWPSLGRIVPVCTSIKLFYMVLDRRSAVSVDELCHVLGTIDPVEFVLTDFPERNSKKFKRVLMAIAAAVPNWENLSTFTLPKHGHESTKENLQLVNALAASTSMKTLHVERVAHWPKAWNALGMSNISLSVHSKRPYLSAAWPTAWPSEVKARSKILENPRSAEVRSSKKVLVPGGPISLKPLLAQPKEVWTKILLRIFSYVIQPGWETNVSFVEENKSHNYNLEAMQTNLIRSSDIFHHVTTKIMYKVPLVTTWSGFLDLVDCVHQKPILGRQIEALTLDLKSAPPYVDYVLRSLLKILRPIRCTPNGLRYFHSKTIALSWEALFLLSEAAGNTLVKLRIPYMTLPDISVYSYVVWSFICRFEESGPNILARFYAGPICGNKPRFPCVERLSFSLHNHKTLRVFAHMRWPNLKSLVIIGNSKAWTKEVKHFLALNGEHLVELDIHGGNHACVYNHCPNLRVLRLTGHTGILRENLFGGFSSHKCLEHIVVHELLTESSLRCQGYPNDHEINTTRLFFESADFSGFTRMHTIEFQQYEWPRDEYEISRALMPTYAQTFKERFKIDIIGCNGKGWRQRLQCRR